MSINTTGYWALVMRALKETGDVASVYTQMENPDNFYIGYIMHMSARHFTMRVMDIDGSHDGWLTGRCADVKQVIAGDDYETRPHPRTRLKRNATICSRAMRARLWTAAK